MERGFTRTRVILSASKSSKRSTETPRGGLWRWRRRGGGTGGSTGAECGGGGGGGGGAVDGEERCSRRSVSEARRWWRLEEGRSAGAPRPRRRCRRSSVRRSGRARPRHAATASSEQQRQGQARGGGARRTQYRTAPSVTYGDLRERGYSARNDARAGKLGGEWSRFRADELHWRIPGGFPATHSATGRAREQVAGAERPRRRQVCYRRTEDASARNRRSLAIWRHRDLVVFTIFILSYWLGER